jgi:NitT/TauT family transport system ATP-binding protein
MPAPAPSPLLRFDAVAKSFGAGLDAVAAVAGVDLEVRPSEFLSIVGPSGCGKSTLLMIAAGLMRASSGAVWFNGERVERPLTDLGIVFQRDLLLDWRTVLGNVLLQADIRALDRRKARAKALDLLAQAGLAGFEERYPWELSGGMRQRVALCRALLHESSLLLLDEPFGALDALTRDQMNLDLQRLWAAEKRTAILVTHSISEAVFLSDRIVVMSPRPGSIAAEIEIDLPRPRELSARDTARFAGFQREVRSVFERLGIFR